MRLHQKKSLKMAVTARASVHLTTVKATMVAVHSSIVATVRSVPVSIVTNVRLTVLMAYRMSAVSVPQVLEAHPLPREILTMSRVAISHMAISLVRAVISSVHIIMVATIVAATSSVVATTTVAAISSVVPIVHTQLITTPMRSIA